jgi:LmbE family N-acetylglucosaminyl deacetylase
VLDVVTGTPARLYLQCLPRSLMHEWVRHKAGIQGAAAYVDLPEIGTPDERITTRIDTGAFLDLRRRAIALHASQASPFDGLPDDLERRFLATDHLIRVQPPWRDGETESDILLG